jgi:hypothetical protein
MGRMKPFCMHTQNENGPVTLLGLTGRAVVTVFSDTLLGHSTLAIKLHLTPSLSVLNSMALDELKRNGKTSLSTTHAQ